MDPTPLEPGPTPEGPEWETFTHLVPAAKTLDPAGRRLLAGYVRRRLVSAHDENRNSQNLVRLDDTAALSELVRSLPRSTPEEIATALKEWGIVGEEAVLETAGWPYRHQSVQGDLLLDERLVHFRLIRLEEYVYVLLCLVGDDRIAEGFGRAFGRAPAVHSREAVRTDDRVWIAWAWFLDPDPSEAEAAAERLRLMWGELERGVSVTPQQALESVSGPSAPEPQAPRGTDNRTPRGRGGPR